MTTPAKSVKEALIATRWIINKLEWIRRDFYLYQHPSGDKKFGSMCPPNSIDNSLYNIENFKGCCTMGALDLVEADPLLKEEACSLICRTVGPSIPEWNDNVCHSKNDVIKVLDRLIKKAK